ncbi:MAG: DUF3467 domain-containing protein [Nanoarchaeota archaeon]|nr:DUF3467 domain-containing protein [Nanoarchaeota archaeon]
MEQKQIEGVNNIDKNPFISNEQTVHIQPDKMVLDFKNIYPEFVANQPIMVVNHRVILMDLYNAKEFLKILKENIEKYEKKLGEIKKPETFVKAEKEIFQPMHQKAVDDGAMGSWGLVRFMLPLGSSTFASHMTVRMYENIEQV